MKIKHMLFFALVLMMAGCIGSKKKKSEPVKKEKRTKKTALAQVNIPVAGDNTVRSFFDEDVGEFSITDDSKTPKEDSVDFAFDSPETYKLYDEEEFAWVEEGRDEADKEFCPIYFNFDDSTIRRDQKEIVNNNINHLCELAHNAQREGNTPEIIVEGHSCKITRSGAYNLALSQTRAQTIADRLIVAGIPKENIKVVGRGSEHWIVEDGSLEEQAPNRRVEIHIKPKEYIRA